MSEGRNHGGRVLARTLRSAGVERAFGLSGGHVMAFFDGCLSEGVQIVDTRHEQAAVHMAEGWALATGSLAVAAVTAGPGLTNAATGIVNAQQTGAPVVVIAGGVSTELDHREAVQQIDATELYGGVAKWVRVARDPARISAYLAEAMTVARSGRPGVAVLQVPMNLAMADAPEQEPWALADAVPGPDPDAIDAAVRLLESAERPVVLIGGGAHWARAAEDLRAFADRTGLPVTTTSSGRGLLPDTHPGCLGYLMHGGIAVTSADVVLLVGSRFNANLVYGRLPLFRDETRVVQIDIAPERMGGAKAADVAIAADARLALRALTEAWTAPAERFSAHLEQARMAAEMSRMQWRNAYENASGSPVHPGRLAAEAVAVARAVCGEDVTFVADGGDALVWALAEFPAFRPGCGLHTSTALGTLGVGVPFANAAAMAHGHPVVAVLGDGAFGLAAMEIDTAVRFDLPVVYCISNNAGWGDVRHEAENWFGKDRVVAAQLRDTDHAGLARALGAHGERVEDAGDLAPAIERALRTNGPALVDVRTDPEVISELLRDLAQLGLM